MLTRFNLCSVLIGLLLSNFVLGQETTSEAAPKKLDGFDWLRQFDGNWKTISKAPNAPDSAGHKGVMHSRLLGNHRLINEFTTEMNGVKFSAIQTLRFDQEKKKFAGQWIDSMIDFTWQYSGELNDAGDTIFLNADGPDWNSNAAGSGEFDATKVKKYRDTYQFTSPNEIVVNSQMMNDAGEWETFMTGVFTKMEKPGVVNSPDKVTPFLMFEGNAEDAIELYRGVFSDFEISEITKYEQGDTGTPGLIKVADVMIDGQKVRFIDSPIKHDFTFTPSISFFVECETEEELKRKFKLLSESGKVMMPIDNYGFSKKFGWTSDQFGVSWQLNLR